MPTVRLAFSPDADDLFMFWPLLSGQVRVEGVSFDAIRLDTEALNRTAESDDPPEICAVSVAHLPAIAHRYVLLPYGTSVGRGYGPVVLSRRPLSLAELAGLRVGIPGPRTTAHLVLQLLLEAEVPGARYEPVVVPITPFTAAFEAMNAGRVDAILVIHEGRLTTENDPRWHRVVELGQAWQQLHGLPLPLGANVLRRDVAKRELGRTLANACEQAIRYSLSHREEVMKQLLASGARDEAKLTRQRLDRYLAMYANEDSAQLADDVRRAIVDLLARGQRTGRLPSGAITIF